MSKITITVPDDTKIKLKGVAKSLGVPVSVLVRDWIGEILKSME